MSLYNDLQEPDLYGEPYYLGEGIYIYPPEPQGRNNKICTEEETRNGTTMHSDRGVRGMADLAFDFMDEAREEMVEKMYLWDAIERIVGVGYKKEEVLEAVIQATKRGAKGTTLIKIIKAGEDDEED